MVPYEKSEPSRAVRERETERRRERETLTVDCQQYRRRLAVADDVLRHTNISSLVAGCQFRDDQVAALLHSDPGFGRDVSSEVDVMQRATPTFRPTSSPSRTTQTDKAKEYLFSHRTSCTVYHSISSASRPSWRRLPQEQSYGVLYVCTTNIIIIIIHHHTGLNRHRGPDPIPRIGRSSSSGSAVPGVREEVRTLKRQNRRRSLALVAEQFENHFVNLLGENKKKKRKKRKRRKEINKIRNPIPFIIVDNLVVRRAKDCRARDFWKGGEREGETNENRLCLSEYFQEPLILYSFIFV